ncbi:MAG TPA: HAMP domain-containing histidine kinase, partial [Bacteroidetes bacterium]|nr:HAMP domain-containing histidine kinase [Bacteroidota bacterium]
TNQFEFNRIARVTTPQRAVFGVKGRRVRDAEGREIGWLIQIRDITQSWEAERFRNEVLSVASHELHTPLTSMYDAVSLLVEGPLGDLNEKQFQLVSLLQSDIERLTRLVEELLDVTRYESADYPLERRQTLDVTRTVSQVIDKLQYRAARKGLSVVTLVREDLPQLRGDRDRLIQVLENLLDNAIKFTPVGGVIEIGARVVGRSVQIWVRDTGVGIPQEHQAWIFEKFARLHTDDGEESGHGLGLSIAKAIVESWGGQISVESKPGQGSTFRFTIPIRPARESKARREATPAVVRAADASPYAAEVSRSNAH